MNDYSKHNKNFQESYCNAELETI